jgi:predicted metal-dependent hydrolase
MRRRPSPSGHVLLARNRIAWAVREPVQSPSLIQINSKIENPTARSRTTATDGSVRPTPSISSMLTMTVNTDGYQRGIRLFNAREFYDAHEVWEDVWRESEGMEKRFLQGLIQAAVAFHHHSTGNVAGAGSLMERARKNLAGCPAEFGGIRLEALLESLERWRAALPVGGAMQLRAAVPT